MLGKHLPSDKCSLLVKFFSHNTLFVGLLFYFPARAHRHKGRKLHFQEAQRRRHTDYSYYCTPHLYTKLVLVSIRQPF